MVSPGEVVLDIETSPQVKSWAQNSGVPWSKVCVTVIVWTLTANSEYKRKEDWKAHESKTVL